MPNWFSRSLPVDLPLAGLISRGKWAVSVFERIGAQVNPSGRLPRALKLFEDLNARSDLANRATDEFLNRIAESHRTVWEFSVIAYATDMRWQRKDTPFKASMIETALGGSDDAATDANGLARNTQFELYVAALLTMGGAEIRLAEPDLQVLYRGRHLGVAIKRMSSINPVTLESRLQEAAAQVANSTSVGYIAINIDVHLRGRTLPTDLGARNVLYDEAVDHVNRVVDDRRGILDNISGLFVFGFVGAWDLSATPPRFDNSYPLSRQLVTSDDDLPTERQELEKFWGTLFDRMDNELRYFRTGQLDPGAI